VEDAFGVDGDVFGEEEWIVLPLGFFVDPKTPVVVGDEGAVFGVREYGLCALCGRGFEMGRERCGGCGLEEGAAT
jgi:hypothetical protein